MARTPDPATWRYNLSLYGPTQSRMGRRGRVRSAPRAVRDVDRASLARAQSLAPGGAVARIIPMPQGQSKAVSTAIRTLITQPESGRVVLPETTHAGGGAAIGALTAPTRDYRADRLGFDAPASEEQLYRTLLMEIVSICGVPWALAPGSGAAGPAIREAQRELLTGTVQPLGDLIVEETARVLETPVTISHNKIAAADTAARARSVHVLTQAGIAKDRALQLVGWSA